MEPMTESQRELLLANGANRDGDPFPAVRLFNPAGAATWLVCELDPEEPDVAFGLADLGFGCPELGSFRISELESVRLSTCPYGTGPHRCSPTANARLMGRTAGSLHRFSRRFRTGIGG